MITTLAGNNRLGLSWRLRQMLDEFGAEHGELAIERLDGEEVDAQAVIDAVQSLPFLSTRKLVVVRSLSANKSAAEATEQIISSVADSTELIFYEPSTDKRTIFYKTLKAKTQLEEFNNLEAHDLPKWLVGKARELDADISLADAGYLAERVGASQQMLFKEIEKLAIYDTNITRQSIDLLSEKAPQSKIFDLLDAAFAGNKTRALELYADQRRQKTEPQEIMAMLAWQLRLITLAKLGQGKSTATVAKDAGLSSFPVGKAQALASRLNNTQLRKMVFEAEKIDRLSKSKPIDLDEAIKTYITTL